VHHALVRPAVAKERDDHAIGFPELVGEGRPRSDGHPRGHDAVGAQHVQIEGGDVHGPAQAAAVAVLPSHELGHHEIETGPLGDAVAVAAMIADDGVVLGEMAQAPVATASWPT
jgi:hypothetical protein